MATRVALANQLKSQLESFWAGAAAILAGLDSPIALTFSERYATPQSAARVREKRLAAFLAAHAYSGRRSPAELPDDRLLMSFPRSGQICADRSRYQSADQPAADAGLAPSPLSLGPMALQWRPRQSGKSRGVGFRWACNRRLRAALTCFADNSRHAPLWAARV